MIVDPDDPHHVQHFRAIRTALDRAGLRFDESANDWEIHEAYPPHRVYVGDALDGAGALITVVIYPDAIYQIDEASNWQAQSPDANRLLWSSPIDRA